MNQTAAVDAAPLVVVRAVHETDGFVSGGEEGNQLDRTLVHSGRKKWSLREAVRELEKDEDGVESHASEQR